ncbi:D-erythronate dehydrogenase [Mycolicibacterium goodii]|uniref:D-erythronate dehydrogenase n=1 Tax=Mycolicibacterium goodii TaxID=134601 RepID=UPI000C25E580|nr:D-erythronate dehydrogenase [Mycolicibacterium goodii]PJK18223.1 NAD-dependent epimerase [Mycolicibacterium goodii]
MNRTNTTQSSPSVLITGGAGFLGSLLAERLLAADSFLAGGRNFGSLGQLTLLDIVAPRDSICGDPRVRTVEGPVQDVVPQLGEFDAIFHLAGVVSGAAEADFDLGMRTNVDATRQLLQHARDFPTPAVFVFASSLAVYGADPAIGPVGEVDDDTLPRPQSSYGVQKFIGEQLVADFSRKGFIDGRTVRLMTVCVRPGRPNAAASSFMSGIIREPLAGVTASCPVAPDTEIALSSPRLTIDGIIAAAAVDAATWGSRTAMNLPALTTTPRRMAEAMDRVTGTNSSSLIEWEHDDTVAAIVESWPSRFTTSRAHRLGLHPPGSFDEIVAEYIATAQVAPSF